VIELWRVAQGAGSDMRIADLKAGWDVVANDGRRIGKVQEVGQHFVKVSPGIFTASIYVPASAIANVEHQTVHLNLASGEVGGMGWQQPPRSPDDLQTSPEREADRDI
jgi:hypothetical protein